MKVVLPVLPKFPNFVRGYINSNGTSFLLAQLWYPPGFWVRNSKNNSNLNLAWILKGFKPFGENLINSLKF
jgi:hypothetical protein